MTENDIAQWTLGDSAAQCATPDAKAPKFQCQALSVGKERHSVDVAPLFTYTDVPSAFQCLYYALKHVEHGVQSWKFYDQTDNHGVSGTPQNYKRCYLHGVGTSANGSTMPMEELKKN